MKRFDHHEPVEGLLPCRKTASAHAKQMDEPFSVHTMEGTMSGVAGDYLMRGVEGELYVCDKAIFEKSYEWI